MQAHASDVAVEVNKNHEVPRGCSVQVDAHGKRRCVGIASELKASQTGTQGAAKHCAQKFLLSNFVEQSSFLEREIASWPYLIHYMLLRTYTRTFGDAVLAAHLQKCSPACFACREEA